MSESELIAKAYANDWVAAITSNVFVAETTEEAIEIARVGLTVEQKHFKKAREKYNPSGTNNNNESDDDFDTTFIAGTPDEVSEQIHDLRNIGVHNLMMKMNTGQMDHKRVMKSIRLYANHLMPCIDYL